MAFLDLAKAFDIVNHQILYAKLYRYGLRGSILELIKIYLTNRKQVVKIGNDYSTHGNMSIGVLQGSILGPLLFIIYINDLLKTIDSGNIVSNADDTAVLGMGKTWTETQNNLNNYLNRIAKWLAQNKLSLNISKTIYITFANSIRSLPKNLNIHINNILIKRVLVTKYLGVQIDCHMR